jgi:hypothetical protein
MSQPFIRIVLNVKNLGNPFDKWVERALAVLDDARRLFKLGDVEVSPGEADVIKSWASAVPGWSEDYLIFTPVGDG